MTVKVITKQAKKRSKHRVAIQSVETTFKTPVVTDRVYKAVSRSSLLGSLKNDGLVDLHAGNKFRKDGFDRRLQGRKVFKRDVARVLDFARFPVTGTPRLPASYRLVQTNDQYVEFRKQLVSNCRAEIEAQLAELLANKPHYMIYEKLNQATNEMIDVRESNVAAVTDWERQVKALRSLLQDSPAGTVLSSPRTVMELDRNGKSIPVIQPLSMNPTEKPANGKMLRPAFNKIEPLEVGAMDKIQSCVSAPLRKMANSHLREIPLKLALWMICKQEGTDPAVYGMTDAMANEMLEKLHERN